jgi:hypothetical protein
MNAYHHIVLSNSKCSRRVSVEDFRDMLHFQVMIA